MLRAEIGGGAVLGRAGGRRLWLLDETSAVLWEVLRAGADEALVADAIAGRFGLTIPAARRYLDGLVEGWRGAGLLSADSAAAAAADVPFDPLPVLPSPRNPGLSAGGRLLSVAQQPVALEVQDRSLRAMLEPLVESIVDESGPPRGASVDHVKLCGTIGSWRLLINDTEVDFGEGLDAVVVATLSALTTLGSRVGERLLVVHGGGLVAPDGRCLLLVAPGGHGKTTLAVALAAHGFELLSDDVVPVRSDGAALGLGLPACVKQGSWDVLASARPDIAGAMEVRRFGRLVRFLPVGRCPKTPVVPSFLIFPQFRPGAEPQCAPLAPERALQGLVDAGAIIRDLDQEKLEALCRWVSDIPAYSIIYPDLASGVAEVCSLLGSAVPAG